MNSCSKNSLRPLKIIDSECGSLGFSSHCLRSKLESFLENEKAIGIKFSSSRPQLDLSLGEFSETSRVELGPDQTAYFSPKTT